MGGKMNTPVNEYGIRVLTARDRMEVYRQRMGEPDEAMLAKIAEGIEAKRKILETLRMVPRHRALVVVPQKRKRRVA
jgi:hypothetical protein